MVIQVTHDRCSPVVRLRSEDPQNCARSDRALCWTKTRIFARVLLTKSSRRGWHSPPSLADLRFIHQGSSGSRAWTIETEDARMRTTFSLGPSAIIMAMGMAFAQTPTTPPKLPLPYRMWQKLPSDPQSLRRLQAQLPLVSPETGPYTKLVPMPANNGSWSNITNNLGFNLSNPLLLTDGTVIARRVKSNLQGSARWYKLAPAIDGSYINGTWTRFHPCR